MVDAAQTKVDGLVFDEMLWRNGQGCDCFSDGWPVARIKHEFAALLDNGLGERVKEQALRQRDFFGFAFANVASVILGNERHANREAGPRMRADVVETPGLRLLGATGRNAKRDLWWARQRWTWANEYFGAGPTCLGVAWIKR